MPTSYDLLFQAIHEEKAVSFTYDKDPDGEERTGLPYVLGRSPDSETGVEDPVVMMYQ